MKEIATCIRTLRLDRQLTQAQLANELGVQYQTVSKWETGVSVPDTTMLPSIADALGVTIDELFGRKKNGCANSIPESNTAFLLQTYSQMYAPEAGPWNLSVKNKYLEYRFRDFFETHFTVPEDSQICNIGIGAGEWDTYLSYKIPKGSLTSIDMEDVCCRQLEQRLICEGNPNKITVIYADAMTLDFKEQFDIVTMVGSTAIESGDGLALLAKAISFVKVGGAIYYQSLDDKEDCNTVMLTAFQNEMSLAAFVEDNGYGFRCHYYKFEKRKRASKNINSIFENAST